MGYIYLYVLRDKEMNNDVKKHTSGVVAFSGGLDTSMLVPYIRENYGLEKVVTCVVDTGAMTDDIKQEVSARADEVGSDEHVCIDAAQAYYDEIIKYLIFGHVSRDGYPLSCLLYTSPSPRDRQKSRMPSSA